MTEWVPTENPPTLSAAIRSRHSERVPFDPQRPVVEAHIQAILEAARWAPTAHNMQNFEIIVVDDPSVLAALGRVHGGTSEEFIRENYAQLSFSEEELIRKGTGLLATMFPPSWQEPNGTPDVVTDIAHGFLDATMRSCPTVMIVVFDTRKRAPASKGDFLGVMSLGCVMQNMWLTATVLGVSMQIMSVFSAEHVEGELHEILSIPSSMSIAFACRLGYPLEEPGRYLRVRREIQRYTHRNAYVPNDEQ
ncbi:MAG: nitroreductase family protein [Acidimicrobiales bacterium]|jgi:nitroreductase